MATDTSRIPPRINKRALFKDLGYEPHAGQWKIHRSDARVRVVACGVRFGKTLAAAMEALAAALEPRERCVIWCVAPTYDLSDRVFDAIRIAILEHVRHRVVAIKQAERRILIRNLAGGVSEIRAKSADNPVSLLGEGLDLVVVDEASRLKPTIWQAHLSQRLIDRQGKALLISTPKGKGWFYDIFRQGKRGVEGVASWNMPSWTNPLLDQELIELERGRLPERVFAQEYGAEFIEGSGAVFRNIRECATGEWKEPEPKRLYGVGLDLAKVEDFTVAVVMTKEREVVAVDRFHRLDWGIQLGRIQSLAAKYNNASVLVDSTGAGEPIYEALRAAGCYVKPYTFTSKSKNDLINNLAQMLERGKIVLPKPELWPEGIDELEAFEYSVTDSGNVRMSAPGGQHDDCVIATALAAWHVGRHVYTPRVGVLSSRTGRIEWAS